MEDSPRGVHNMEGSGSISQVLVTNNLNQQSKKKSSVKRPKRLAPLEGTS